MSKFQVRPTSMGLAFVEAAAKAIKNAKVPEVPTARPVEAPRTQKEKAEAETARLNAVLRPKKKEQAHSTEKVDHAPWVARRIALNQSHIGLLSEPSWNAHLSLKTFNALKAKGIM